MRGIEYHDTSTTQDLGFMPAIDIIDNCINLLFHLDADSVVPSLLTFESIPIIVGGRLADILAALRDFDNCRCFLRSMAAERGLKVEKVKGSGFQGSCSGF